MTPSSSSSSIPIDAIAEERSLADSGTVGGAAASSQPSSSFQMVGAIKCHPAPLTMTYVSLKDLVWAPNVRLGGVKFPARLLTDKREYMFEPVKLIPVQLPPGYVVVQYFTLPGKKNTSAEICMVAQSSLLCFNSPGQGGTATSTLEEGDSSASSEGWNIELLNLMENALYAHSKPKLSILSSKQLSKIIEEDASRFLSHVQLNFHSIKSSANNIRDQTVSPSDDDEVSYEEEGGDVFVANVPRSDRPAQV